jgi:hypothetical protein
VLRGCRMISVGKIAALTQVRMRADLTTFFGSLRRAQELSSLVGLDPCLVTTTVLRCPLAVSIARRFLTSASAWRWVENKPRRSSPTPTDQPSLMRSTRKIVVIACLATNERSTNRAISELRTGRDAPAHSVSYWPRPYVDASPRRCRLSCRSLLRL